MWLCLNDAFLSIVKKDCPKDSLLVRARRPGDIEKVFGRNVKVTRSTDSDYLYRTIVPIEEVKTALERAVEDISYENFKDSVKDHALHLAYMRVWNAMSELQNPRPFSTPFTGKKALKR
jgi:hypothetical protein